MSAKGWPPPFRADRKARWPKSGFWPFLLLALVMGCQTQVETLELGKNKAGTVFYLEGKQFSQGSGRAAVILKMVPEKGGQEFRGVEDYLKRLGKESRDFGYIRGTFEMDCPSGLMRMVRTDYYDRGNRGIVSNQYENTLWGKVPFESVGSRIRQMVCPPS
ncbi:MAG: hypothetical protein MUF69_03860 [Desulfobacterota bacterium]|jgi:hypothetical protein|nr:hypothetical protein [Thermodesulfobacteriota bacterium]